MPGLDSMLTYKKARDQGLSRKEQVSMKMEESFACQHKLRLLLSGLKFHPLKRRVTPQVGIKKLVDTSEVKLGVG